MSNRGSWGRMWVVGGLWLAPLAVLALDPAKSIFQYNCQSWTRQTGLPAGKINAIAQTTDGYLWLGTQNGLVRFDGGTFTAVPINSPEARGREVRSLVRSAGGGLLVAINNGAFGRFDGGEFTKLDDPRWPRENLSAKTILEARDGAVWVGSNIGVGRMVPAKPEAGLHLESTKRIFALCEDGTGRIWVGAEEGGVYSVLQGERSALLDPSLASEVVSALAADASGHVWVGDANALRRYDGAGQRVPVPGQLVGITALLVDRHGTLWAGTQQAGLARWANGAFTSLREADGLASDYVTSLYEDAEGSIWVGTRDGLSQLSDLKFPLFTEKEGIVAGSVHMVAAARDGGLWIASTNGVCHFDGRIATEPTSDGDLTSPYIKLMAEARNGDLHLLDGNRNLNVLSGGRLVARYACEKWPEALVAADEGVLVGQGPTLWRVRGQALELYPFAEGQNVDFQWFDHMCVARDGAIWLPCYGGIFRIKNGQTRKFDVPDWRTVDRLRFVMEDGDGSIWVGASSGLIRVKDGRLARITEKDGLYDSAINAIVADDHGYFWIDSGRGIYRVARQSLNDFADGRTRAVHCEAFEGLDVVKYTDRIDQEYSGCKTGDGRIWFPNARGVVMIDPANFFVNKVAPPVCIDRVQVDGMVRRERERTVVPAGTERVEFNFAALSFIAPQKVQVRYQLEGLDKTWVEAGGRRSVVYSNLRHGQYTFRVQACNADGVWNTTGAAFAVELLPFFYETAWFFILCGLAGLAALFGAYRWKVRRLELRERKLQGENDLLEAKVAERTHELSHERDLLRALLENSHDSIYFKDTESRFVKAGQALAVGFGVKSPDDLIGRSDADFLSAEHARLSFADEQGIMDSGLPLLNKIEHSVHPDGHPIWVLTSKMPWRGKDGTIVGTFGVSKDITAIKEAERKLVEVHKQLLETSRQAGMAEVATSVLHNVGNVLNSVNVSVTLVADRVRVSKVSFLPKIGAMLQEHAADLGTFLAVDPKGRAIVPYLVSLGGELVAEQDLIMTELDGLRKNIDHIKEIVAMQQSYALVSGVADTVPLTEIVEDAIRMNLGALDRHQVNLVRDFASTPTLTIERHKVLQVLVNLIRNAKYACDDSGRTDKQITMRIVQDGAWVRLSVIDNGIGIPPENLTRIFGHGFTTRKGGHGFGLHSGSLAAKELGGSLTVQSDGIGTGAVFTINLPLTPPRT